MGPGAGVDIVEKRKSYPCRDSNPGRPAPSPCLYRLSYPDSYVSKIKMDLKEVGYEGKNCIQVAQDRVYWQALMDTELNILVELRMVNSFTR